MASKLKIGYDIFKMEVVLGQPLIFDFVTIHIV